MITGDHHIGSFPSTGEIDDYHVPFIIYSPMLKAPRRFLSVNSHNNITPTILSLLFHHYPFRFKPAAVHWLAGVMDTVAGFRNTQSMAFMSWGREINDYLYKNYFLSENELYRLTPTLMQEPVKNDSLKHYMKGLRSNFEIINRYVCDSNRVYPNDQPLPGRPMQLLKTYAVPELRHFGTASPDTAILPRFVIPPGFKFIYVQFSAHIKNALSSDPTLRLAILGRDTGQLHYITWSKRSFATLSETAWQAGKLNAVSAIDQFAIASLQRYKELIFEPAIYSDDAAIDMDMQQLEIKIYGIK